MLSSHQAGSQGAPAATRDIHIPTSAQEIANVAEALVHASPFAAPGSPHTHSPPPAPAPTTQFVSDVTVPPVAASASSHGGRPHSPPRGTARVTRSSSALPELGYIHPRPIPVPGGETFRRSTAHYAESETFGPTNTRDDQGKIKVRAYSFDRPFCFFADCHISDQFPPGTVGFRLEPTVEEARTERDKAERTGENEAAFAVQCDC